MKGAYKMDKLITFIKDNCAEQSNNPIEVSTLKDVEEAVGVKLGEQLKEYLLKFGYLAYKYVELYGVNSKQQLNSDMVINTTNLHENFPCTCSFIALENIGDGDYILIDSNDYVYEFIPTLNNELKSLNKRVFEYIYERFTNIDNTLV